MVQSRAFGALPAVACPQHRVGARLVGLEGPPGGAMPASGICPWPLWCCPCWPLSAS